MELNKMEPSINIFSKLPQTKEQVENYTKIIRESVLNGEVDALDFAAKISALEKLFTTLKSDILIKDCILNEAEKYGKSFEKGNAKFNIKEVGVTYDFSNCNDFEYEKLSVQISELTEKKKTRESFLKGISIDTEVYGSDGVQLLPAIKRSTTQVTVTLK